MHFQYVPHIWPFIISSLMTLILAIYALNNRHVRGALPFGLCMIATVFWATGYTLELVGTDLPTKLFWTNFQTIGYTLAPVLWLIMVFSFTGFDRWVTQRNLGLLLICPVLAIILAWINGLHGQMWNSAVIDLSETTPVLVKTFGPLFWLITIYSYLLNLISEILLGISFRRKAALFRQQSLALFIGLALILIPNILFNLGISPFARYDYTSAVAGVSGVVIAVAIFRFHLFNIVPVARDNIIENMADGLIVLDSRNRVADMNLTARKILGFQSVQPIGQQSEEIFKNLPFSLKTGNKIEQSIHELVINSNDSQKIYELSCQELIDRGKYSGFSIILHDITERKTSLARLMEQQRELAKSEVREILARDLHDNLGQVFGFINVQAQAIKRDLSKAGIEVASHKIDRMIEAAQSAHREMREYIRNVKNDATIELDFFSSLKKEIEQIENQTGIDINMDVSEAALTLKISSVVKSNLLNIVKEALNNVRKHARAKKVTIDIRYLDGNLCLKVTDDGLGFDSTKPGPSSGFGLNIMRERAKELGGGLNILSVPGQGAQIIITVEIKNEANDDGDKSIAGR